MGPLLYYLLIKPVSLLPMRVLHGLSTALYFTLYHLAGYRKKVVQTNLVNSFPDKTPAEIERLMRRFYQHFCDLILESIKMFSMSEKEAIERCRFKNPEVLEKFYREGRSILIIAGHYNSWEMAALAFAPQCPHLTVGIYQPIRNAFFNRKIQESRGKYGMVLVAKNDAKQFFADYRDELTATLFGADQSPTFSKNVYWTTFLNQETAVAFGAEKYAKEYDSPPIFTRINKIRRSCYEIEFTVITENPRETAHGEITEAHTRMVEKQILEDPAYWLWTHKRWKRKRQPSEV
jgi:KDO2-lipid IV(A) lauroyltransferase